MRVRFGNHFQPFTRSSLTMVCISLARQIPLAVERAGSMLRS